MMQDVPQPGRLMAAESAEAAGAFCRAAQQTVQGPTLAGAQAVYTIARGSSDAAANILSYEIMRTMRRPVTSLPPSVFSIGAGVAMQDSAALIISQSGASDDLVRAAKGASGAGARVLAITNQLDSPVEAAADATLPIGAGPELAVPATKSVVGSVGAGLALLAASVPDYAPALDTSVRTFAAAPADHPRKAEITSAFLRARHVYVIGRDTGYGAAQEMALKLKECCALHAEAFSSSEVLHGPLQLATNPLMVLILDTGAPETQDSLDQAEARFRGVDCDVIRIRPADVGLAEMLPAVAACWLLTTVYPIILNTALALGLNPDAPKTLSKVTQTT